MQLSHVQHSIVGDENVRGISGGQRKRVNIGMELAAAPSLLLLDEPTSGLDSTAAMHICQVLKDLASVSKITVAMVIHQPRIEIWEQLDDGLLLAPGGITVYQGPQHLAQSYFTQHLGVVLKPQDNPGDALMDHIAAKANDCVAKWRDGGLEAVQELQLLKTSAAGRANDDTSKSDDERYKLPSQQEQGVVLGSNDHAGLLQPFPRVSTLRLTAPFPRQVILACTRNLWKQINNLSTLALEIGLALLAAGLMGALGEMKYQGVLSPPYTLLSPTPLEGLIASFFSSVGLAISLAASSAGVSVFSEEQVIYRRAGHNHLAYYLGTIMVQIPRLLLDALHFAWIFHLINQPLTPFAIFFVVTFMLYTAIYGLSFIVSFLVTRKKCCLVSCCSFALLCFFYGKERCSRRYPISQCISLGR